MSLYNFKIETNLDENLKDKLHSLFCEYCNRPNTFNGAGACVGCSLKVDLEIKEVPSLLEGKCEFLGNDGHCFYCKDNDEAGQILPSDLCNKCTTWKIKQKG